MNNLSYQNIVSSSSCQKLIIARRYISLSLTLIMLLCYCGFMIMIALFPDLVGSRVSDDRALTWGVVAGMGIILIAFLLTGYYTWYANFKLEPLKRLLVQELKK